MKYLFLLVAFTFTALFSSAQTKDHSVGRIDPLKKLQVVDAACGQCKFGLKGKGCNLAVRVNGKSYFVDGMDIDNFGDAHANDGFCNAVRKAEVQGELVNNRFKATYFNLLKEEPKKESQNN